MMRLTAALLLLGCCGSTYVSGLTTAEWKRRTIYQVLTDRFALADGASDTCGSGGCPYGNYCGGTFKGITEKLDYIKGMGFDAIWISPVVDNMECGYHGYWARNQFAIEEQFGGAEALKAMMTAAHGQGIAVMLDIVGNHMGPSPTGDYSGYTPFNSPDHYHGTPSNHCAAGGMDQQTLEKCWLANLADLAQENPFVTSQLVKWMQGLLGLYGFDGIRIDTVPYVPKTFWQTLMTTALNGTYAVGEVLVQNQALGYLAGYQTASDEGVNGPLLSGILNYPLFNKLRDVFQRGEDIAGIQQLWTDLNGAFKDAGALGNFVENHDNPRWLEESDVTRYQNALAVAFFLPGVPIAYYGTEQGMAGGKADNDKRQPLWSHGGYNTASPLYIWTGRLVAARQAMLWSVPSAADLDTVSHMEVAQANGAPTVLSFQRGAAAVIVSSQAGLSATAQIQSGFAAGQKVCDMLAGGSAAGGTKRSVLAAAQCSREGRGQDCGQVGSDNQTCTAAGCCWQPVNPNPTNEPWCFKPGGGPSPPPPPPPPPGPPGAAYCVTVGSDGTLAVQIQNGLPRIMMPGQ